MTAPGATTGALLRPDGRVPGGNVSQGGQTVVGPILQEEDNRTSTDYYCKNPSCKTWLFDSDASYGRVRMNCPKCHRRQMHFLGGFQARSGAPPPTYKARVGEPQDDVYVGKRVHLLKRV